MQITIDDTIYHDLAEKIGSTNVNAYIEAILEPILYFDVEKGKVIKKNSKKMDEVIS